MAFGYSAAIAPLAWVLVLPLLMGMVFESTVGRVLVKHGASRAGERLLTSVRSSVSVLLRTLHWRLLWPLLALIFTFSVVLSPFTLLISAIGLGHIAVIDGLDVALALRGVPGRARVAIMARSRRHVRGSCRGRWPRCRLWRTACHLDLVLPAVYVGAALLVAKLDLPVSDEPSKSDAASGISENHEALA